MFAVITIVEKLRLEPQLFEMPLHEGLRIVAKNKLEDIINSALGIIVSVIEVKPISEGLVIHGDPCAYYECEVQLLCYKPEPNEIVEGEINSLLDFGAFVSLGPLDGLIHLSQFTNDFMTYNRRLGSIVGKEKGKSIKKGDLVYAKVATVSWKKTVNDTKLNLTMKDMGLGKVEWLEQKEKLKLAEAKGTLEKEEKDKKASVSKDKKKK
ncbi:MAG: DNA-directed RNA polymerase [Candidatus Micrarchaeota archaeon]|nr:DNA-directed RNA polymerase [Candidatus Micrarchaeota archaeon]